MSVKEIGKSCLRKNEHHIEISMIEFHLVSLGRILTKSKMKEWLRQDFFFQKIQGII